MNATLQASLRRRFRLLLALRWMPVGLSITVLVLLLQQRGLSLAEIGVGTAAQGLVMLVLELPSGGLADALGRKPVLVLAGVLGLVGSTLLLVADNVALLAVAFTVQGVFRALDSGPLQAWFVDEALTVDPRTNIEHELSRGDVTICASLGAGALLGSGIVRIGGVFGLDPLVAPLLVGVIVQVVGLVALVALLDEQRIAQGWTAARRSVADVPAVMRGAVGVIRRSSLLTALVVAELCWGFGAIAFETLFPPRLAELGAADTAAEVVGPVVTAAWVLSAAGAAVAPVLVRRFGAPAVGFGLRSLHGAAVVAMGLAAGSLGVVVFFLASYAAHGATGPVHYGLVHRAVGRSHRATVVSANSLAAQVGFAVSGVALGALSDGTSISTAMVVAGIALAAAAPLYLIGHQRRPGVIYNASSAGT